MAHEVRATIGPIVDCNVHLWDQGDNPVFWLSDRTLLRDMLGDYDSLPDRYTLADYRKETKRYDVRGVIWSDAGAADALAAADWASRRPTETPPVVAMVTLGDPMSASFGNLVARCQPRPLIRSIRIRLVPGLSGRAGGDVLCDRLFEENLELLAASGLVATVEATSSQLNTVTRLAAAFPALKIVIDHFGWPDTGPGGADRVSHMQRLASLAAFGNVATRIDAIGTIFGEWSLAQIRPWLVDVTSVFGPQRCMLGSDSPIENLRSGFGPLYAAYDAIFSACSDDDRTWLFHRAAEHWYASAAAADTYAEGYDLTPRRRKTMTSAPFAADTPGIGPVPRKVFRTELNPVDFLHRAAYLYPDKVAVVDGGRRYSYSDLAERSWRLANALRSAGLRKGDRVATLLLNSSAMLEAHFGVPAAGGILVAVNHRLASAEIGYILQHSAARYLILDAGLEALTAPLDLANVTVIRCANTAGPDDSYEELLAGASSAPPESWLEHEEETISINYTSGTTGRPKGVQYTYRGAYLNALAEVIHAGLASDSVYLWTLPMFHCNGWCFPWAVTAIAARHVTMRMVDPELAWALIDSEGVTHYNGAPTVQLMILNHPRAHRLERPVTAMVAAAPPSPTLFARMTELNFRVVHVYGLTETYGPITVCPEQDAWREFPAEQRARYLARQGQAYVTSDLVRVVDGEMNDIPRDGQAMGEVVMRGNNVMSGYYQDQPATSKAFAGDWFHSGDLAVWHPDGNIELRDRGKDVIISGGENISSIEVEQTIVAHPAVLECAVIGIPHPHWGERPKAFVTLNDDATATPDEVIAFCRERLAHYKCPDAIEFGPLPKTSTGKIQKFVLRDREWAGHDKRIGAT